MNPLKRIVRSGNLEAQYAVSDFVNPESYDRKSKAWVILWGGVVEAIVFSEYTAYCDQDALDAAADAGKLGRPLTQEEIERDYEEMDSRIVHLGNAGGEPYDQEGWDMWDVPASLFEEDPALMTFDRVIARLESDWLGAYKALKDAEDACTLARLIGTSRTEFRKEWL